MPEPKRPLKVFLCHAHADRDAVRGLYARLTKDGVDAWLDKEKLLPGQDWELEIRKAVREADVVVVCLSKQFNQTGFRQKEVRLALDTAMEQPEGEIFIIPARLEECVNLESLRKWHWVDLFEEDGYEMLMRALRTRADKIGVTLKIKKSRTTKIRNSNEVIAPENGTNKTNAFEPINVNSNSAIQMGKLDQAKQLEKARIKKEEIEKRRLPYFEPPLVRKSATQQDSKTLNSSMKPSEDISLRGSSSKHDFLELGEQLSSKKSKSRKPIKTEYIVAIIGAVATIIAGIFSSPLIENWFSPTLGSTESATAVMTIPATSLPTENTDAKAVPMVLVPAGEFMMGSDEGNSNERPVHKVILDAFWIDKTEVTNTMYAKCAQTGKCNPPYSNESSTHDNYYGNPEFDDYPVIFVSWNDAKAYCEWADRRLPTEAEWEKAARGTDERIYPWGGNTPTADLLNFNGSIGDTTMIGKYLDGVSPYGVLDMAGNVWEWVNDLYSATYYSISPVNNPLGPDSGQYRILRGGAWSRDKDVVRTSYRQGQEPSLSVSSLGFRCARDTNL